MSDRERTDDRFTALAYAAMAAYRQSETSEVFRVCGVGGKPAILMYADGRVTFLDEGGRPRPFQYGVRVTNYVIPRLVEAVLEFDRCDRGERVEPSVLDRVVFEFAVLDGEGGQSAVCRVTGRGVMEGFERLLPGRRMIVNYWFPLCARFISSMEGASSCPASSVTALAAGGGQGSADHTASSPPKNGSAPGET